ncbi:MAG: ATP-grasp enzyme [Bacteroidota bacterium]
MKSLAVLLGLGISAVPALLMSILASIRLWILGQTTPQSSGRTVLLTGGKMTKCLQLARLFHAMGDRVIVAETETYKWCGTRFSKAVDQFLIIPTIQGDGRAYCRALVEIAEREKVDLFVPVASPKAALYDAIAKPMFPAHTEVFHFDEAVVKQLDDKHQFIQLSKEFGLSAPESYLIDSKEDLLKMKFTAGKKYILKKVEYDPVYRLDLRTIPHEGWQERVRALPISPSDTWVMQEFIEGQEICTHTTTQNGAVNLYVCSDSSPFQVNYAMLDLPNVSTWVETFTKKLNATGQISFDFIIRTDGEVIPIECNPRTHSAITVFYDQPLAAQAYYTSVASDKTYLPSAKSKPTYWLYHELYRILTSNGLQQAQFLWRRIWTGKEAVFSWADPWPFWFNNHINIPYQILQKMKAGVAWTRIDFNIGKLIVQGGD